MLLSLTLTRYLVRSYLLWFGIFLLGTVLALGLCDFAELIRRVSNKPEITMPIIVEMVFLKLPSHLERILPFTAFFSAIFSIWRLTQHHEIVVLRTAGASGVHLLLPSLLGALVIGGAMACLLNPFAAMLSKRYHAVSAHYLHHADSSGFMIAPSGLWLRQKGKEGSSIWHIGKADINTGRLFDVTILHYDSQHAYRARVAAAEGYFLADGIRLTDTWLSSLGEAPAHYDDYFMKTNLSLHSLRDNSPPPETISFWQLPYYVRLLKQSGFTSLKYELHWHSILANCAWFVAMVMLGGVCAMRQRRQNTGFSLLLAGVVISFMLFFLKDIAHVMGQASTLSPLWAIWMPPLICSLLGWALFLHIEET